MDETGFFVSCVTFIGSGILTAVAESQFFRALERRQPGVAAPDEEVLDDIGTRPSQFGQIMVRATRLRLSALARSWPYPEVERLRKLALASIAVSLVLFGWIFLQVSMVTRAVR